MTDPAVLEERIKSLIKSIDLDREERMALDAKLFGKDGSNGALGRLGMRVTSLERWRSYITGALAVMIFLLGIAAANAAGFLRVGK